MSNFVLDVEGKLRFRHTTALGVVAFVASEQFFVKLLVPLDEVSVTQDVRC